MCSPLIKTDRQTDRQSGFLFIARQCNMSRSVPAAYGQSLVIKLGTLKCPIIMGWDAFCSCYYSLVSCGTQDTSLGNSGGSPSLRHEEVQTRPTTVFTALPSFPLMTQICSCLFCCWYDSKEKRCYRPKGLFLARQCIFSPHWQRLLGYAIPLFQQPMCYRMEWNERKEM